jgi:hypothetical protein
MNGNLHRETTMSNDKRATSASSGKKKTESYENLLINKYLDDLQQTE